MSHFVRYWQVERKESPCRISLCRVAATGVSDAAAAAGARCGLRFRSDRADVARDTKSEPPALTRTIAGQSGSPDEEPAADPGLHLTQCYLRLANLPSYPLDRLSRYEYMLWRQVAQILFALDGLNRRKPQERRPFLTRGGAGHVFNDGARRLKDD